jgi:hypothetical protein
MVTISITIPEEIRAKLKLEENQSALISRLLSDYFKNQVYSDDFDKEIIKFKETKEKIINNLKEEENKLLFQKEQKEKEINEEIQTEHQRIEKDRAFIQNVIKNAKDLFNTDITEQQARDYKNSNFEILLDYLVFNGIVKEGVF